MNELRPHEANPSSATMDSATPIELDRKIDAPEDDWTGLSSAADRRKLQNRLNQRAYRKRNAAKNPSNPSCRRWIVVTPDDSAQKHAGDHDRVNSELIERRTRSPTNQQRNNVILNSFCGVGATVSYNVLGQLQNTVYQGLTQGSVRADLLLSVMQFNILRGIISNILSLGMTVELLQEDIVSPFSTMSPWAPDIAALPPSLRPTALQKQIAHHPWIDPFPVPSVRDLLLRMDGHYDDLELCKDLFEECDPKTGKPGLIIWGDPWDAHGFELSDHFVKKWGWMFKECVDICQSTNYWRAQRGERPIFAMPSLEPRVPFFHSFEPVVRVVEEDTSLSEPTQNQTPIDE